jgi:ubiquinone/menaquinone biosynthesis C-methylase UbiE
MRTAACVLAVGLILASGLGVWAQGPRHARLFAPEELGVLEGADRDEWQKPDAVMDAIRIGENSVVSDLGAGGGWFTVRLSRRVGPNGIVYAQDVQREMLQAIRRRVAREGLANVHYIEGKTNDPRLPARALDAVLIVDAYHEFPSPVELLRRVGDSLKPGGRIGVINFSKEGGGPGPPFSERIDEKRVIDEAEQAGLRLIGRENFLEFQYFLIFGRS